MSCDYRRRPRFSGEVFNAFQATVGTDLDVLQSRLVHAGQRQGPSQERCEAFGGESCQGNPQRLNHHRRCIDVRIGGGLARSFQSPE